MNEFSRQATHVARSVWRYRWLAVAVAWAVALVGASIAWIIPERYAASASIYVDTQTVLKPLMAGLAFQPDIDQQVQMIGRTLVSRPTVEALIKDPAIGLSKGSPAADERQVDSLMKSIKVELNGGTNMYAISYRDIESARALKLVEALVGKFMDVGIDSKRKDSQDASHFIDDQIKLYEAKLTDSEGRLKEFKLRNMAVAGGAPNQDYFGRMSALTDDINRLRVQLSAAEQSREAMRRELASEEPQLPSEVAAVQSSYTPELDARIETQKRQLDEMLRRYTDVHPDVLTTRRTIAQLELQRRQETDAKSRAESNKPHIAAAATNPVFQRLRIGLAEAEANVASLRSQLGTQLARLEETRSQAGRMPQAEAELAQLNRDYDVIRKNYDELVTRREAASFGVKIDQSSALAEFRVIEPPRVLPTAVFPNRIQLAVAVMVLAVLAGCGVAYGMTILKPTFASEKELREFTKRPVLGGLTRIQDAMALALDRHERLRIAGVTGLFVMSHLGWIAFLLMQSRH